MVSVLIPTKPDDGHAIYTKLALEKKGHQAILWHMADFPIQQLHSFELINKEFHWFARGMNLEINNSTFDTVWYRRPKKPTLPSILHPDDKDNAKRENITFIQSLWDVIAPDAKWINPPKQAMMANSKMLQLKLARQIGLKVPHTLVSNDPDKIKQFILYHGEDNVIYKTLYPMVWLKKQDVRLTYTRQIRLSDLPPDPILQITPGIFQNKITKAYEVRITYFGDKPIAAKIHSQTHPKGAMDWRYIPIQELIVEEYRLPSLIHEKCKYVMKQLGLVFACFDFIVTHDNDYYFLELNESGQFLWLEEINPSLRMLDAFTNFIVNIKTQDAIMPSVSLFDFKNQADILLQTNLSIHQHTTH